MTIGFSLLQNNKEDKDSLKHAAKLVYAQDKFQIYEDDICAHLSGYLFPSFFLLHTTKQNKYSIKHPHDFSFLICTINLTLTSFMP